MEEKGGGFKFILNHNGLSWHLVPEINKIVAIKQAAHDWNCPEYTFWIANPPPPNSNNYHLFHAICSFAVHCGMLRPVISYALQEQT